MHLITAPLATCLTFSVQAHQCPEGQPRCRRKYRPPSLRCGKTPMAEKRGLIASCLAPPYLVLLCLPLVLDRHTVPASVMLTVMVRAQPCTSLDAIPN